MSETDAVAGMGEERMRIGSDGNVGIGGSGGLSGVGISNPPPDYNIVFSKAGERVGKLDFNDGCVKFEGKFEESAERFVEYLSRNWADRLQLEQSRAVQMIAEMMTFELDDEVAVADSYRKGFMDAMSACRAMLKRKAKELES